MPGYSPLSTAGLAGRVLGALGGMGSLHSPECCCWRGHQRGAAQGTRCACHMAVLSGSHPLPLFVESWTTLKSYEPGHFGCAAALPMRGPCVQQEKPSCVGAGEAISWLSCTGDSTEQSDTALQCQCCPSRLRGESRKRPWLWGCDLCTPTMEYSEINVQPGSSTG